MRPMRWSSLLCALAFFAAMPARAAEQGPTKEFEAVSAPELVLQPPDLDRQAPVGPAQPEAPAESAPAAPPTPSGETPEWWDELKQGIDREMSQAEGGSAGGAGATGTASAAGIEEAGRSAGMALLRAIAATCIVVALILVCYYLANRYGKKSPLFAGSGLGRILGRIHLSPKAELYFVRVKDCVLVVGVTANGVSRVAEFDAAMFDDAQPAAAPLEKSIAPQSAFAKELRAQTLPEPTSSAVSDELAALKADLDKARQHFRETSGEPGAL